MVSETADVLPEPEGLFFTFESIVDFPCAKVGEICAFAFSMTVA